MVEQDSLPLADIVTLSCLKTFSDLPKKGKPVEEKEWTVLAGIIEEDTSEKTFNTVALGTGTKCIGPSKMQKDGKVIHDSHAEVIARRAFKRYIYHHLKKVYKKDKSHVFKSPDSRTGTCCFQENIQYHLYISHTPCGDASIIPVEECTGLSREEKVAVTKTVSQKRKIDQPPNMEEIKKARVDFSLTDVLRTGGKPVKGEKEDPKSSRNRYHIPGSLRNKPGRGEATISMSCSDKIAKWNATGCLGALLSHFVMKPLYLTSIVIGKCPYSEQCMRRAVCDRISHVTMNEPYKIHTPRLLYSHISFKCTNMAPKLPCATSLAWSRLPDNSFEALANGYKLGATCKQVKSATAHGMISKYSLFHEFKNVQCIRSAKYGSFLDDSVITYRDHKDAAELYQNAWKRLRYSAFCNWILHDRDLDCFTCNASTSDR